MDMLLSKPHWFNREPAKIDRRILDETTTEEQKRELWRQRDRLFEEGGKRYEAYFEAYLRKHEAEQLKDDD
jgi:hypothetical protein